MFHFIVPAYNESQNLPVLMKKMSSYMQKNGDSYTVLIVDDGSSDDTQEVIKVLCAKYPLKTVRHQVNKGPGQAFLTGLREVLKYASDSDIVITKEADNTSDLSILKSMIDKINNGSDLVLASCYADEGGIEGTSFLRIFLSSVANLLLKLLFSIKGVHTYSSFYRVYKTTLLKQFFNVFGDRAVEEKGFACMAEMLIKFNRITKNISEVPMILRGNMRKGKSKMRILKTTMDYLFLMSKLKLQFMMSAIKGNRNTVPEFASVKLRKTVHRETHGVAIKEIFDKTHTDSVQSNVNSNTYSG
jgi:dolichol-phosphate mannosyltransferase